MTPHSEWRKYKLGELAQYVNGKAFKPEDWDKSGLPIIRIQNLTDATKPFNYCNKPVEPRYLVNDGDLLISWSATLGSFIWARGPAVLNQHIFKTIPNAEIIDREFLHYLMLETLDEMASHTHGIAMKHITKRKFEAIGVSIPLLAEQSRIVGRIKECLDRAEEVERLRDISLKEAASVEYSGFHDALTSDGEHGMWPVYSLGEIAESFRYGTSAKAYRHPDGTPVLRMGNLRAGHLDTTDLKYIQLSPNELSRYRLKPGDILINRTNSLELVGKAATFDRTEGDWVYASYLVRVEIDRSRAMPEFVTAAINGRIGRDYVVRTARRAIGMVNLNAREMAKFPIPLPPLAAQHEIVSRMKAVKRAADGLKLEMAGTEIGFLRQGILRRAFTGEL